VQRGELPRRLLPFAPLFASAVIAVPHSGVRIYAALLTILAAFYAAVWVITERQTLRAELDLQTRQVVAASHKFRAARDFTTLLAIIGEGGHEGSHRSDLHRRLSDFALDSAQQCGVYRNPGGEPRVVFYLLNEGESVLRRFRFAGWGGDRPPWQLPHAPGDERIVDIARTGDQAVLIDAVDGGSPTQWAVPVHADNVRWGVLVVESSVPAVPLDGPFLEYLADGLASALTLLGDDPRAVLTYNDVLVQSTPRKRRTDRTDHEEPADE
jgi:hypothetical protein